MNKHVAVASPKLDPKNVNGRLYDQIDILLSYLEERDAAAEDDGVRVTLKERIAVLIAIARIQVAFVGLRKEKTPDDDVPGSAVRKYATAFANDARRRTKPVGRRTNVVAKPEPDDDNGEGLGSFAEDDDPDAE